MTMERDHYRAEFESQAFAPGPAWLKPIRRKAMDRFLDLGFPTTRDEEWKYTNVAPIARLPFRYAANGSNQVTKDVLFHFTFGDAVPNQLVFINGRLSKQWSKLGNLPSGVQATSLSETWESERKVLEDHFQDSAGTDAFYDLNTSFFEDAALVVLPKGTVLSEPIHLMFVSAPGQNETVSYPRIFLCLEEGSKATVIESYFGLDHQIYFTNSVTESFLENGAALDHYKIQRESETAYHVSSHRVRQERNSLFSSHSISLGAAITRNDITSVLAAEGADCTLNGLYMVSGKQLVDNHTTIDHAKPHGTSRELYKGILDEEARGVFNGKILVRKDAQKTNAQQTNRNLLLSEHALVDTKPQLEIHADDVKCAHGATIGQLDEEALYYLRARGVGLEAARNLLTYAFGNELVHDIPVAPVRVNLECLLASRFAQTHHKSAA
ncbi:MAG TPA: Fe-S cluster assembly protein SufD [Bdellovibrionota bacterium]|nr:Fe-S cluster assembly protein SufD [Bdellovibrionota bacterium]